MGPRILKIASAFSAYSYGSGIDVLGHVVEEASGMRLSEFFEKEIFKPLGMQDTAFSVPKTKSRHFAALYFSPQDAKLLGVQRVPRGKQALVRIDGNKPEESRWFSGRQCKSGVRWRYDGQKYGWPREHVERLCPLSFDALRRW